MDRGSSPRAELLFIEPSAEGPPLVGAAATARRALNGQLQLKEEAALDARSGHDRIGEEACDHADQDAVGEQVTAAGTSRDADQLGDHVDE
jgi:hypothetical protein